MGHYIKEIVGPEKSIGTLFPKRLVVIDLEIFDKKTIVENFNKFFSEIRPKIGSKIQHLFIFLNIFYTRINHL